MPQPGSRLPVLLLALSLLASVGGCRPKQVETLPAAPAPEEAAPAAPRDTSPPAPPRTEVTDPFAAQPPGAEDVEALSPQDWMRRGALRTVYFGFDRYDLSEIAIATLRENAEWIKAYPRYGIVVEGHCDERGTIEYNLALGERRADAVRRYLVGLGVPRSRVRIVTYGEERPADSGHDESAWSRNRRAEFVIE